MNSELINNKKNIVLSFIIFIEKKVGPGSVS